jgi:hypothetical protein
MTAIGSATANSFGRDRAIATGVDLCVRRNPSRQPASS